MVGIYKLSGIYNNGWVCFTFIYYVLRVQAPTAAYRIRKK